MTENNQKKVKWVGIISAAIITATPGVYAAWQGAKQAWQVRVEAEVSDKQAVDLQQYVKALEVEVTHLQQTCVTHKDLVGFLLQLQRPQDERRGHQTGRDADKPQPGPEPALGAPAAAPAPVLPVPKPRLKAPQEIRSQVQQKAS